jgi:hypothetical protein
LVQSGTWTTPGLDRGRRKSFIRVSGPLWFALRGFSCLRCCQVAFCESKRFPGFVLPKKRRPALRITKITSNRRRTRHITGTRMASTAVRMAPIHSPVATTGFPRPPVRAVDLSRRVDVVPCTMAAAPPPAIMASVHFRSGWWPWQIRTWQGCLRPSRNREPTEGSR